ncbi:MAG TPA: DUF4097 family beta strand repeat-containing protein [Terriglobia bacterium]|nr:DUF4097 family beta strand repeat-containing protein [Terriglobia bacterium]
MANNPVRQKEDTPVFKGPKEAMYAARMVLRWGGLSVLLLPMALAQAANIVRQDKTIDTTANPHIGLSNFMGHVVVKGWDKPQVHAVYSANSPQTTIDLDQLPASGTAEKIHFTTRVSNPLANSDEKTVSYTLEVPMGADIEIRNPEGRVEIDKLQGDTTVDSVGGAIAVTDASGRLTVTSIAGNIDIIRPSGHVEATTICGNIHFISPTGTFLKGHSTSGKITYEGDFVTGGEYAFSDYSGDIDLLLPSNASFELNKNTGRGKFFSEISPARRANSVPHAAREAGAHSLFGSNVSTTATLKVSSYSGNIHIRRQP